MTEKDYASEWTYAEAPRGAKGRAFTSGQYMLTQKTVIDIWVRENPHWWVGRSLYFKTDGNIFRFQRV